MRLSRALTMHPSPGKTILVTNQPFFYKNAEILPDSTFVVGVDTAVRLINVSSPSQQLFSAPLEPWLF